jgi:hypothetical protein
MMAASAKTSRSTVAGLVLAAVLAALFALHLTGLFPLHTY